MPNHPRKGRSHGRHLQDNQNAQIDFTVYDYSNSGRMSKNSSPSKSSITKTAARELPMAMAKSPTETEADESLAWYERELSDFELSDHESNSTELKTKDEPEATPTYRRRLRKLMVTRSEDGCVYPLHLWVVIGDWVDPEDVARFAGICHGSHVITHTARFWITLYHRHYKPGVRLPETLRPACIGRIHGMRSRVVRALYSMYNPLKDRLQHRAAFDSDPDTLKGRLCSLMWHKEQKGLWYFYFKFVQRTSDKLLCPFMVHGAQSTHLHDDLDIHANPEQDHCVLEVVCKNYQPCGPAVMGQVLAGTTISVSHGMRYHKMKLTYTPQQYSAVRNAYPSGTTIVLDPVVNVDVLHWWNPKYPLQPH